MILLFDDKQIVKFERVLEKSKYALKIADQMARNEGAKDVQETARKIIDKRMTVRNAWTKGSIQVERSSGGFQKPAIVGSRQEYMADQEFGATAGKGRGHEGRRMTTPYASGEGDNARPRKKVARGKNKIKKIQIFRKKYKYYSKKQKAFLAVRLAAESGNKFVFMNMPWTRGKKGIYKVLGGKRRPRIKMVHSMKKKSVVIPKNPWLKPAVDAVIRRMPNHYFNALQKRMSARALVDLKFN